jgi:uncharacterized protein YdaT
MYETETVFKIMTKLDKTIKDLTKLIKGYNNSRCCQVIVTTSKTNKVAHNVSMDEITASQEIDHNTTLRNKH